MILVYLFLLCAGALASVPRPQKPLYSEDPIDLEQLFEEFVVVHGKQYPHEEEKKTRFEIFKKNVAEINRKNSDHKETATFAINKFMDLTTEEFLERYTGFKVPPNRPTVNYVNITRRQNVPDEFDWRTKNVVSRVKNQAACGSCWAFSVIGTLEGAYSLKHQTVEEFSEQQLVDCDKANKGCRGGYMQTGIQYLVDAGGSEGESDYPYTAREEVCKFDKSKVLAQVTSMLPYNLKDEEVTKQLLVNNGPIAIALDASSLQHYNSGILKVCMRYGLNHAVLLVGYGQENGTKYWIIKNSWSDHWGEDGYIRLEYRGGDNPCLMYNEHAAGAEVA